MELKLKKFIITIAVIIVSLAWINGSGAKLLYTELIFGNILAKIGVFFLSFWLLGWFFFHTFYIVYKREVKTFIVLFCFLFWFGALFFFPVIREVLSSNISLQLFIVSIIIFDGFILLVDILEAIKEEQPA